MNLFTVANVLQRGSHTGTLIGSAIDAPVTGQHLTTFTLLISGWVLSGRPSVTAVVVTYKGEPLGENTLGVPRTDVKQVYPRAKHAEKSGYQVLVDLRGLDFNPEASLEVFALLSNGQSVPVGAVVLEAIQPIRPAYTPHLQPLLVTFIGRSGSTWLMRLLSEHPQVVVHNIYPYETGIHRYWLHAAKILSQAGDHDSSAHPNTFSENSHWVGHNPYLTPATLDHPEFQSWFLGQHMNLIFANGMQVIDTFYRQVAQNQDKAGTAQYYAEKLPLKDNLFAHHTWSLYSQARELILVRDLRDVLCSVKSFNSKRGFVSFGYNTVKNELNYVQFLRDRGEKLLTAWQYRRDKAFLVRYEQLITEPKNALESVFHYLGVENSPELVQDLIQRASASTSELEFHRTSTNAAASIGRWKHDLDDKRGKKYTRILGPVLQGFGYTP